MPFKDIDKATIQSGQPGIGPGGFGEDVIDNLNFLNGQIGSLAADDILNGSFEVEGATGIPANWERTLFAGGAGAFETANPMHGEQGYKFTHPGGGGNGGGSLESEYFAIGEIRNLILAWMHYVSAAGMHETVEVKYYTATQVFISTQTIYDSTSNPTTATNYQLPLVIPATARFIKVKVIGGDDNVDVAGDSFWDGIRIVKEPLLDADATEAPWQNVSVTTQPTIACSPAEKSTASGSLVLLKAFRLARGGTLGVNVFYKTSGSGTAYAKIYRNGSPLSLELDTVATTYTSAAWLLSGWSAGDLIELYGRQSGGTTARFADFSIHSNTLFGEEVTLH